jgi:hypothetical protein
VQKKVSMSFVSFSRKVLTVHHSTFILIFEVSSDFVEIKFFINVILN